MKKTMLAILAGVTLVVAGCVSNVTETTPGSMPAYRDRVDSRYQRPLNEVYEAAKRALNSYGNITREGSLFTSPKPVRILQGSVNQREIWMRLEEVSPSATLVIIQVRSPWGGTDLRLANELAQGITMQLTP